MFGKLKRIYRDHQRAMSSVRDNDIIALAKSNQGKLTSAALATRTGLTISQARMKLNSLYAKGVMKLTYDKKGYNSVFELRNPELLGDMPLENFSHKRPKLQDADVIKAAVEVRGRLTPAILCVKAKVSIEMARSRLQELQQKGVFDLEVSDEGAIVYLLMEYETFREIMDNEGK